jgi:hypothetical protein
MIRHVLAISACLLITACASTGPASDEWSQSDTRREIAFQFVNVLDAVQTNEIRGRTDVVEVGRWARSIMGTEPSRSEVATYFVAMGLSHYLISRALPPRWRKYWQAGTIADHGYAVVHNCAKFDLAC